MSRRVLPKSRLLTPFVVAVLIAPLLAFTTSVGAQQTSARDALPTAAVSLGDSYISGEAGRWEGNSSNSFGNRSGTDRAAERRGWFWRYVPENIYGSTFGGCGRSDVAPILSADLSVDESINLACAGAGTANVISSNSGGVGRNGEAPQVDQLAAVAATHDVELVVLSIGGNDLGFSDIVIDCVLRYSFSTRFAPNTCAGPQQDNVTAALPNAMAGVATALDDIHRTLAAAGDTDYRLVLQSYPAPLPEGDDFRYSENGFSRLTRGCPFWDSDADWTNQWLIPTLTSELEAVAAANNADFLDLSNALSGREACADTAAQGSGSNAEWVRFVGTGITQGNAAESVHPNAFGQQALGTCLRLLSYSAPGDFSCTNTPGGSPTQMNLSSR